MDCLREGLKRKSFIKLPWVKPRQFNKDCSGKPDPCGHANPSEANCMEQKKSQPFDWDFEA